MDVDAEFIVTPFAGTNRAGSEGSAPAYSRPLSPSAWVPLSSSISLFTAFEFAPLGVRGQTTHEGPNPLG